MDTTEDQRAQSLAPYVRWAALLAAGGAAYLLSQKKKADSSAKNKTSTPVTRDNTQSTTTSSNSLNASKKKTDKNEKAKAAKPKQKPSKAATPTTTTTAPTTVADAASSSAEYDHEAAAAAAKNQDREFARQFASAKAGTKFEKVKKDEKRQKSVKQSRAQEIAEGSNAQSNKNKLSAPSSTGDADDDLSPAVSPIVQPTTTTTGSSQDVSDMLEPAAAGPSVLRLTDVKENEKPTNNKKLTPVAVETKKQRQNRKKAEKRKEENLDAEKERKTLMEKTRRDARIAEGRAAKDGSAFMANQKNAWTAGDDTASDSPAAGVLPLDTQEQTPVIVTTEVPADGLSNSHTPKPAVGKLSSTGNGNGNGTDRPDSWVSGPMLSEEEQMEMIRQDEAWNEVSSRKKRGRKNNAAEIDTRSSSAAPPAAVDRRASETVAKAQPMPVNGGTGNGKPVLSSSSSFTVLTPDDNTDGDVEEEWDV